MLFVWRPQPSPMIATRLCFFVHTAGSQGQSNHHQMVSPSMERLREITPHPQSLARRGIWTKNIWLNMWTVMANVVLSTVCVTNTSQIRAPMVFVVELTSDPIATTMHPRNALSLTSEGLPAFGIGARSGKVVREYIGLVTVVVVSQIHACGVVGCVSNTIGVCSVPIVCSFHDHITTTFTLHHTILARGTFIVRPPKMPGGSPPLASVHMAFRPKPGRLPFTGCIYTAPPISSSVALGVASSAISTRLRLRGGGILSDVGAGG